MPLLRSAENRWSLQALVLVLFVGFAFGGDCVAAEPDAQAETTAAAVHASVRLAIAPVTVASESEHKEFAQELPKNLGRLLLRDGRVELVPLNDVRQTLASFKGGHLGAAELRGFASQLDAAYIAVWRLYESAEKLRLVMFLVPSDNSAAKVQRLELKADDEEKLAAQFPKLSETVERLLFEKKEEGTTAEVPSIEVPSESMPEEPRPAPSRPPSGSDRIVSIRVRGNHRIEARAILARMVTREGDAVDPQHIARDIHSIYQLGFFRDVNIFREPGPEGWVVTVVVHENPVIQEIAINGNKKVDSEDVKDVLTLTTGAVLDHTLLRENVARIESLYHTKGYYLAKISYLIKPKAEGFIEVDFEIKEGKKLHLRKIRFEGNKFFSDRELRKGLKTKPWHFWSPITSLLTHEGTYAEAIFSQDLRDISQRYSDEGYLRADIGEPKVEITKKGIELRVTIDEGDRYRVGTIDVAGDETVDLSVLRRDLKLKQGEIFNRSALTEDVEKLTGHYTDRGFYFANVSPETNLKQGELVVDVTYDVEKGPLYFIRNIQFSGNTTTVDPVLRREMSLVEGELYSARALEVSRKRLKGLGFFEEVEFEPKPTDTPGQLDLTAKIVERPTGSFSLGAGFSSQEGAIFTGSLSQSNLFGRGYGLRFSADLGSRSNRFYVSFSNPYFLGSEYSLVSTIFRSEVSFEDFQQRSQGFSVVVGHPLNEDRTARGFLGYNLSDIEIDQSSISVAQAAPIQREREQGSKMTSALTLSYRSNTLDDFLSPSEGAQLSGSLEVAGLGGFSKYARVESRVRYFIPGPRWMPKRSTFVVGASVGYAEPFNQISDWDLPALSEDDSAIIAPDWSQIKQLDEIDADLQLPLSERYFLGGLGRYQLRGYKARSLGPRRAILKPVVARRDGSHGALYTTVDRNTDSNRGRIGACLGANNEKLPEDRCNRVTDQADSDFANLNLTDVIGGNKFISMTGEYRFSISEAMGLVGVLFFDAGNAFAEGDSLFDVGLWRYGTGVGVQWFSPFGPLQAFYGIPLNKNEVEDASVFEFSMGGQGF